MCAMVSRHPIRNLLSCWALSALLLAGATSAAEEKVFRVAVIAHSPPLSYTDENGRHTGFNIEIAHELCVTMKIRCALKPMAIEQIVDTIAADQADFAVVGFIATPERKQRILFSKTYFHSLSVWLAKPSVAPGNPENRVAVIKGSAQALYAESMGWRTVPVITQKEISTQLTSGAANAALMPMLGALSVLQEKLLQPLDLKSTPLSDPSLANTLHMCISPKQAELLPRINAAIDQIKLDGRFDRINTKFIPFRLM
jgi:polar amino acid transport system substrate-binding protein